MAFTDVWDVTQPPDTQLANLLGQDIRNLKLDTQQRMAAISGISTAMPNFATDAQPANWAGILFFATDNGHIYQFNGTIWVDVTATFIIAAGFKKYTQASGTTPVVIPANTLAVGSVVQIFGTAEFSGNLAGSLQITANGTNLDIVNLAAQGGGPRPNRQAMLSITMICFLVGASGQLAYFSNSNYGAASGNPLTNGGGIITLNTTSPIDIVEVLTSPVLAEPLSVIVNT
jgi:hypothetical protein